MTLSGGLWGLEAEPDKIGPAIAGSDTGKPTSADSGELRDMRAMSGPVWCYHQGRAPRVLGGSVEHVTQARESGSGTASPWDSCACGTGTHIEQQGARSKYPRSDIYKGGWLK